MTEHEIYMNRCLQLAKLGAGNVAPNPMVGAVLVYKDRIIGEGYHRQFGEPHAEVNCIASVKEEDESLISKSTLYVSLEPCAHFGKTPPCADMIIRFGIPKVVIGCQDPFEEVNARLPARTNRSDGNDAVGQGKGIEKLRFAEIEVVTEILEDDCRELNKRFLHFHTQHRPYIILKWAQSANGMMAEKNNNRVFISNDITNRLVHKWRSEEASILVGTNTALVDDPELTNRLWPGPSPVRLVVDMDLRLPSSLKIFNDKAKTIVFNSIEDSLNKDIIHTHSRSGGVGMYKIKKDASLVHQISDALYQLQIQSVLVEGGARLLQSFIDKGMWDEARVITNQELIIRDGFAAPVLSSFKIEKKEQVLSEHIIFFIKHIS